MHDVPARRSTPLAPTAGIFGVFALVLYLGFNLYRGVDATTFYVLAAAVAVLLFILTFVNIFLSLSILIACVGLSPEFSLGGVNNLRIEDFIVVALTAAWFTRAVWRREPLVRVPVAKPMLAYFAVMVLSTIWGIAAGTTSPLSALLFIGKNVEYGLILLIVVNNVKTEREFRALVFMAGLAAVSSALMGLQPDDEVGAAVQRLQGPLGETPNIFGGYLILNLSILLGLFLHAERASGRVVTIMALGVVAVALLFTYSRGSYVAMLAGLTAVALLKERRLLVVGAVGVVIFILLAPASVWQRASTIAPLLTEGGESWSGRTEAWDLVLTKVLGESPLLGFGMGSADLGYIDSEYFLVLYQTGVAGMVVFLWLILRIGWEAKKAYEALEPRGFSKGYAAGYLMAYAAFLTHAVAATSFSAIRTMECFMILTGLLLCMAARRREWALPGGGEPEEVRIERVPVLSSRS